MDKTLYNLFQKIHDTPIPLHLHERTMRGIFFYRAQKIVTVATIITGISFMLSIGHLYSRLTELDIFGTMQMIFSAVEFDLDSINSSLHTLFAFVPVVSITVTILNMVALAFTLYLVRLFKVYATAF